MVTTVGKNRARTDAESDSGTRQGLKFDELFKDRNESHRNP